MKKIIQFTVLCSAAALLTACSSTRETRAGYESDDYYAASGATAVNESSGAQTRNERNQTTLDNEVIIPLYEEQLNVGKRTVNSGQVRIRKIVTTDTVSRPIELRRETVVIERLPRDEQRSTSSANAGRAGAPFEEREITIQLQEEQPVVEKQTVATGRVVARKTSETERQTVERQIRREDVQLDRSGNTANLQVKGEFKEAAGAEAPRQQPNDPN